MPPLHVLVCPDAFKGSLSAHTAAAAIASGVKEAAPTTDVRTLPLADGGEGTAAVLVAATGGRFIPVTVTGPAGRPVNAAYGVLGDGQTAVVEAASAAGLLLLSEDERDPRRTTSVGVGQLLAACLEAGYRRIILSLGGSGTNDGGLGLWTGLGGRARTAAGAPTGQGGAALAHADVIDATGLPPALAEAEIIVASDVNNPLLGPTGATHVYGPQKGADSVAIAELEAGMAHWATVLAQTFGRDDFTTTPGAGAAGGMALPLLALGRARIMPGFQLVAETTGLHEAIAAADLVITGEGRLDGQTLRGKVVHGVAALAQRHRKPCLALGGSIAPGAQSLLDVGVTAMFALPDGPATLPELMKNAAPLLQRVAGQAIRLFQAGRNGLA